MKTRSIVRRLPWLAVALCLMLCSGRCMAGVLVSDTVTNRLAGSPDTVTSLTEADESAGTAIVGTFNFGTSYIINFVSSPETVGEFRFG